ncbi:RNA recognition motif domain (RRM 6) [Teratosphaeria destructans]|uniref:RNA recognition motif domain (RRM 6) n=1 Tax=Teratosphaeria destructans TaxID=418781 RepID=A0A9W7SKL8_9PEZI|nr:RNA recognition motif domain (RRM 6) [Teratosphaeria destructans]
MSSVASFNSRTNNNNTQFLIVIHGVRPGATDRFTSTPVENVIQLPERYTWQDLKDLIRREASHGIWTNMVFFPDGSPGSKGSARMQRKDEALRLFDYLNLNLIEGRRMGVHLWDTSRSPPQFLQGNCLGVVRYPCEYCLRKQGPSSSPGSSTSSGSSYSLTPATRFAQQSAAPAANPSVQTSTANLTHAMANMKLAQQDPRLEDPRYQAFYQQQYQQALRGQQLQAASQQPNVYAPVYAMSSSGTPVNTRHGTVRTEARGVFVNGLSYKARTRDVEEYFRKAGQIIKCDVHKDHATGKSKGVATIQYASTAEARKAIEKFNDSTWMGMRLKVRHDREATAVSPPPAQASKAAEPIIVNGSQVR